MSTLIFTLTGLAMLYRLCKPFNGITTTLFVLMLTICGICIFAWPLFFDIMAVGTLALADILFVIVLALVSPTIITILYKLMDVIKL
jgi:hypothetical protein